MRTTIFLTILALLWPANRAPGGRLTRQERIEWTVESIGFQPMFSDPIPEAEQAPVREELVQLARASRIGPEVQEGLPEGTRDAVRRGRLILSTGDREECRLALKFHLMYQVVVAENARIMPRLTPAEQQEALRRIDVFLDDVQDAILACGGGWVTPDEVRSWCQGVRDSAAREMNDLVLVSFKAMPSEERLRSAADELRTRLAESRQRVESYIATTLKPDDPDSVSKFKSWFVAQMIEPMRLILWQQTRIPEEPFRENCRRVFPDYWEVHDELKNRQLARIQRCLEKQRKEFEEQWKAQLEFVKQRTEAIEREARLGSEARAIDVRAGGSPATERRIELPTSRPASQPAAE